MQTVPARPFISAWIFHCLNISHQVSVCVGIVFKLTLTRNISVSLLNLNRFFFDDIFAIFGFSWHFTLPMETGILWAWLEDSSEVLLMLWSWFESGWKMSSGLLLMLLRNGWGIPYRLMKFWMLELAEEFSPVVIELHFYLKYVEVTGMNVTGSISWALHQSWFLVGWPGNWSLWLAAISVDDKASIN